MSVPIELCDEEVGYEVEYSNFHNWGKSAFSLTENAVVICISGEARIELNLQEYSVGKDYRLCLFGDSLFRMIEASDDFECAVFRFPRKMLLDASVGIEIELFENIFRNPCMLITSQQELNFIHSYLKMMSTYKTMPHFGRHYEFVCGMIRCLMLSLSDSLQRSAGAVKRDLTGYSTADNYFRSFMKLLTEHSRQQHDVAFYADKLNITPKYLNEICRKKAQTTAKDAITRYVIALIRRELILTGTSVQRIAYDFNFCDQSSFGKYFKKSMGMAPMTFRRQYFLNNNKNGSDKVRANDKEILLSGVAE